MHQQGGLQDHTPREQGTAGRRRCQHTAGSVAAEWAQRDDRFAIELLRVACGYGTAAEQSRHSRKPLRASLVCVTRTMGTIQSLKLERLASCHSISAACGRTDEEVDSRTRCSLKQCAYTRWWKPACSRHRETLCCTAGRPHRKADMTAHKTTYQYAYYQRYGDEEKHDRSNN